MVATSHARRGRRSAVRSTRGAHFPQSYCMVPAQAHNLAAANPAKLKELLAIFEEEAKKSNVYPLDSTFAQRGDLFLRPSLTRGHTVFIYFPGTFRVPEVTTPDIKNRDFTTSRSPDGRACSIGMANNLPSSPLALRCARPPRSKIPSRPAR